MIARKDGAARQSDPCGTRIHDADLKVRLDTVCRTAADLFGMPIVIISLAGEQRCRLEASYGLPSDRIDRADVFHDYAIEARADAVLVVPDLLLDARFATAPLVTAAPHVRFNAGVPLAARSGKNVGTMSLFDTVARLDFGKRQRRQLRDLARMVEVHLHLREAQLDYEVEKAERLSIEVRFQAAREFQAFAEQMACLGHWRIDVAERTIAWSAGIATIFGRNAELLPLGLETHLGYYHPDDLAVVRARIEDAMAGRGDLPRGGYEHRSRVRRPNGDLRHVCVHGLAERDEDGRVVSLQGICLDVTDLARSERELRTAGALLRTTLETMDQGLLMLGPDQRVRIHNRRAHDLLDLPDDLLHDGAPFDPIRRHQLARGEFDGASDRLRRWTEIGGLEREPITHERLRPNGTWLEVRGVPLPDGGVVRTYTDVTRRRAGEEALQVKSALLDTVLDTMDQGLMMIDAHGVVQVCNTRAVALLDLPPEMMRARPTFEAVRQHQLAQQEFDKSSEAVRAWVANSGLERAAHTYERERPNGTVLEIRTVPLPDGGAVRTYTDVTQRRASERTVQESEGRYRLLAENTTDVIVWCDLDTTRRYVSPAARSVFGYEPEELVGTRPLDFVHPDDVDRYQGVLAGLTEGRTDQAVTMQRYRTKAGDWVWIEASFKLTRDPSGVPTGYVAALRNVTDRKAAEERLRLSEERLSLALSSGSDGLWDWDLATGAIQFSDHWFGMLGYRPGEIEPHIRVWDDFIHPDDDERARRLMIDHVKGLTPTYECEYRMRRKSGGYVWTLARGKVVSRDETGRAIRVVGTHIDITRRKEAEQQIAHMATHDGLTGLANRTLFHQRLELALANAKLQNGGFAILACDLDRFKVVNDTLGHPAGDVLLRVIADRLQALGRTGDTVARLGGDEFAIIIEGLDTPQTVSVFAQRVIEAVERPVDLDGHTATVSVSIGIALGTGASPEADILFKHADTALYRAKAVGRNGYSFYDPSVDAEVAKRSQLERDLRDAVRRGGFVLYYQPIVAMADESVGGFEALLRWQHPTRGAISPAEFIPLAEETGLIIALGEWAIREACHEAASWPNDLRVAVNVSAVQFQQPGLEQIVLNALIASGLAPHRLELEITESVLMQDSAASIGVLHRLKGLGVRIALDDFGTGFSSLSYLRRFPFDKIKIDRSFIRDIADPDTAAIVRAIVGIGVQLGATVTAEGVETQEQLEQVRQEGCTEVQGFFYSKPITAPEALDFARTPQRQQSRKVA